MLELRTGQKNSVLGLDMTFWAPPLLLGRGCVAATAFLIGYFASVDALATSPDEISSPAAGPFADEPATKSKSNIHPADNIDDVDKDKSEDIDHEVETLLVEVEEIPDSVTERVVDQAQIRAAPRRSTEDLLELAGGVLLIQHGSEGKGQQIMIRGFDAAHGSDVAVTVAGVGINEVSNLHGHGYLDLNFIPAPVVSSMLVSKGPYRLVDGNFANAGAIDLELGVQKNERGLRFGAGGSSTLRRQLHGVWAPKGADRATFLAAEWVFDPGVGQNRWHRRKSIVGQYRHRFGAWTLRAWSSLYDGLFGLPAPLRSEDFGTYEFWDSYVHDTQGRSSRVITAVSLEYRGHRQRMRFQVDGQGRALVLDENFTGFVQDPIDGDRRRQLHRFIQTGIHFEYLAQLTPHMEPVAKLEYTLHIIDQAEHGLFGDGTKRVRRFALRGQEHIASSALGLRWRPLPNLRVDAGGRFEAIVDRHEGRGRLDATEVEQSVGVERVVLSPRVRVRWGWSERGELFGAYGRGFRSPEARKLWEAAAVGGGKSEELYLAARVLRSDSAELGATWRPLHQVQLSVAGFGNWMQSERIFDHLAASSVELGATQRWGLDGNFEYRPWPWLTSSVSGTWTQARFRDSKKAIPGAAPWLFRAQVQAAKPGSRGPWTALSGQWVSRRTLAFGGSSGPMFRLDLTGGYRIGRWALRMQLENVLNLKIREGEYEYASWWDRTKPRSELPALHFTPGPPLSVFAGIEVYL